MSLFQLLLDAEVKINTVKALQVGAVANKRPTSPQHHDQGPSVNF